MVGFTQGFALGLLGAPRWGSKEDSTLASDAALGMEEGLTLPLNEPGGAGTAVLRLFRIRAKQNWPAGHWLPGIAPGQAIQRDKFQPISSSSLYL